MTKTDEQTKRRGRRYRGRPVEELAASRRLRLLEAGKRLFAREGYGQVSIERICSEARVSTRHFYEHFQSREALLLALFETFQQELRQTVLSTFESAALGGAHGTMEQALLAVRALARHCMNHPGAARIALVETVGVSREIERHRRRVIRAFAALVARLADRLAAAGIIPPADYYLPAVALVGATNELLVEWLSGETQLDQEQMENQIVSIYKAIIEGAIVREQRRQARLGRS